MNVKTLAKYFLSKESMTHKKLQKLCYYAQAWHLTLYDTELVDTQFEAWVHGPVSPELYHEYKHYRWNDIEACEQPYVEQENAEFIDMIYDTFGPYTGDDLEYITHQEDPWRNARSGKEPWETSNTVITYQSMKEFYTEVHRRGQGE